MTKMRTSGSTMLMIAAVPPAAVPPLAACAKAGDSNICSYLEGRGAKALALESAVRLSWGLAIAKARRGGTEDDHRAGRSEVRRRRDRAAARRGRRRRRNA